MEYKYTYYEIIETVPGILKAKMPLVYITRLFIYFPTLFFLYIKTLLTGEHSISSIFKKKEKYIGKENNPYIKKEFKFENEPEDEVKETETEFYNRKTSEKIIKNLIEEGYEIDIDSLSFPLKIKKKVEYVKNASENKVFIVKSYPKIAEKIKNLIKDPYEDRDIKK